MSDKASCPRCGGHFSDVYYDSRCSNCGWNCDIEYSISAYGDRGRAEVVIHSKPSAAQRDAVAAFVEARETHVEVRIDGAEPRRLTPWLDPDAETPEPISGAAARRNLNELRQRRREDAGRTIDAELGL